MVDGHVRDPRGCGEALFALCGLQHALLMGGLAAVTAGVPVLAAA
jgi:hypothetical protein